MSERSIRTLKDTNIIKLIFCCKIWVYSLRMAMFGWFWLYLWPKTACEMPREFPTASLDITRFPFNNRIRPGWEAQSRENWPTPGGWLSWRRQCRLPQTCSSWRKMSASVCTSQCHSGWTQCCISSSSPWNQFSISSSSSWNQSVKNRDVFCLFVLCLSCQLPRVAQGVTVPGQRPPTSRLLTSYCLIGRFYTALFSAVVQTHWAHVACGSEWMTMSFFSLFCSISPLFFFFFCRVFFFFFFFLEFFFFFFL